MFKTYIQYVWRIKLLTQTLVCLVIYLKLLQEHLDTYTSKMMTMTTPEIMRMMRMMMMMMTDGRTDGRTDERTNDCMSDVHEGERFN